MKMVTQRMYHFDIDMKNMGESLCRYQEEECLRKREQVKKTFVGGMCLHVQGTVKCRGRRGGVSMANCLKSL